MENSRRAVSARVADLPAFLEAYPRAEGEPMPIYWARLHHVLDRDQTIATPTLTDKAENEVLAYPGYKPTKAHLTFAVDPVKTRVDHQPMKVSGFCMWPGRDDHGHGLCWGPARNRCECDCHEES